MKNRFARRLSPAATLALTLAGFHATAGLADPDAQVLARGVVAVVIIGSAFGVRDDGNSFSPGHAASSLCEK